jgi:hypothetical protein
MSEGQVLAQHRTRIRQRGPRWQALCACGWHSRATLRWSVTAWDASAGHLLNAREGEAGA